jgi:ribonucleotide reductase alpha subunit
MTVKKQNLIAARLTKAMTTGAYRRSIQAGAERGNYLAFDKTKLLKSKFIQNMIADKVIPADFKTMRNVCNTTVAPVGTGNLMVQGWANGTEPGIGFIYWRRTRVSGEYVWYFVVNEFVYELIKDYPHYW